MHGLGDLEATSMDVLWRAYGPLSVRDVLTEINQTRDLAYTTVMTVLDNLHRKGWVERERDGRAYLYRPTLSREEAAANALRDLLDSSGDPEGALLHFARGLSSQESDVVRRAFRQRQRQKPR